MFQTIFLRFSEEPLGPLVSFNSIIRGHRNSSRRKGHVSVQITTGPTVQKDRGINRLIKGECGNVTTSLPTVFGRKAVDVFLTFDPLSGRLGQASRFMQISIT